MFFFQSLITIRRDSFGGFLDALRHRFVGIFSAERGKFHLIICAAGEDHCRGVGAGNRNRSSVCVQFSAFGKNFEDGFCFQAVAGKDISQCDRAVLSGA